MSLFFATALNVLTSSKATIFLFGHPGTPWLVVKSCEWVAKIILHYTSTVGTSLYTDTFTSYFSEK
jgi:hypothetical protein